MTITKEKLTEWKALADNASKPPWTENDLESTNWFEPLVSPDGPLISGEAFIKDADRSFCAAARTIVPELIAEVERLKGILIMPDLLTKIKEAIK